MKPTNILVRSLSGALYILLILAALWLRPFGIIFLAMLFGICGLLEFQKITIGEEENSLGTILADIACLLSVIAMAVNPVYGGIFLVVTLLIRFIEQLYILHDNPLRHLGMSMLSIFYLGIPMACMVAYGNEMHPILLLLTFLMIWINDTGAFLVGCTFGRHRLFERISPKKSWEGFFGGLGFNIVFAIILWLCGVSVGHEGFGWAGWVLFAIVVTVIATFGDLVESMIKRSLHVKDSGNVIPGHGGLLDRIDSLLFAVPASWVFFEIVKMIC